MRLESCPACAATNPRGAVNCSACGTPLGGEAGAAPAHAARQMADLLVDEAGELFEQRRYGEARTALSEALDIDRFDARARKLQWAVHLALEQQRADRDPAGALPEVAREIEQRLQGGDLRDAAAMLQAAQAVHGDPSRLHDLKARLDLLEAQQREAVMGMADALTLEAERLVLEREYEQAENALREALELDPMNLGAAKLLGDVHDLQQASLPGLEEDFAASALPPPAPPAPGPSPPPPVPDAVPPRAAPPEPRFLAEAPPTAGTSRWLWLAVAGLGGAGLLGLAFCG